MRFNLREDIWKDDYTYAPSQDSKYKRLQKKPINTLSVEEIKYLYVIDRLIYSPSSRYDTIEDAYKALIDDDRENSWDTELFEDAHKFFSSLSFPLTIYRALRVGNTAYSEIGDKQDISLLRIGGKLGSRSWTTNINIYKDDRSIFKNQAVIVAAEIEPSLISNATTIQNYINYTAKPHIIPNYARRFGEYEISLKDHFKVSELHNLRFVNKNEIKESFRKSLNEMILRESRGDTTLRQCLCSVLNLFCGTNINYLDTVIHHKNGNHDDNDIDNLIIFRKIPTNKNANTSIHARHRRGDFIDFNSSNPDYTDNLYDLKGIDVWKSLNYGRLVSTNGRVV